MPSRSDIGREPASYLAEKVNAGDVRKDDADLILRFITEQTVENSLAEHTAASNTRYLAKAAKTCPGISKWTYDTITKYVSYVRKEFKPNTSRKDIINLRSFVTWLIDNHIVDIDRAKIAKIKPTKADKMTKQAVDMLTAADVQTLIRSSKNSRDRAMLAVLFEGALRPFELLDLTWGGVLSDEHGAVINTAGKTGKPRRIRLILSAEYLNRWRNDYPTEIKPDSPIFVNQDTTAGKNLHKLTRVALRKVVDKAKKALPGKRVHPYLFRHSRVTEMLAQNVPESVIKLQAWGSISSPMLATYGHLSGQQTDDLLLAASGIETKRAIKAESALKPQKCLHCGKENLPGIEYCGTCGAVLDPAKYQKKLDENQSIGENLKKLETLTKRFNELQNAMDEIMLRLGTEAISPESE